MSNALPEWLLNSQPYAPPKDKDAFVDKSILSTLSMLSKIRTQSKRTTGKAQAAVKLSFVLLTIVLVALAKNRAFVLIVLAGFLVTLCLKEARQIAQVLKTGVTAALFAALVLLPAGFWGNWHSLITIAPKVFISAGLLSLLSITTRFDALTSAMRLFLLPDLFIFVLDITLKYIYLLGEFSLQMLYALKLRSVGRNDSKRSSLSGIAGNLFLRSREMANEMHDAMACRGFTGEYTKPAAFSFHAADVLIGVLAAAIILVFFVLERVIV